MKGAAGDTNEDTRGTSIKIQNINLQSGDYFGERALMYNEARAADVIATSDCTCYTISGQIFNMVLGSLKVSETKRAIKQRRSRCRATDGRSSEARENKREERRRRVGEGE